MARKKLSKGEIGPGKGRGKRPTHRYNVKAMAAAEEGMIMGEGPRRLADRLADEYDLTPRTIETYFLRIRNRWAKEEEDERPGRRAHFRQMLMLNFQKSIATDNPMAGAATLRILAKLDGHETPIKIEVSGRVDVLAMSPMERRAEIVRLLQMRDDYLAEKNSEQLPENVIEVETND